MQPDHYFTIGEPAVAEFKDRGSKFIAFAFPVDSVPLFKEKLTALKKEHPKASHHCFAYRIGTDGNLFRASDDGEPSGTAGKPILGQIDSKQVTNVLIIVVRYFGGTLLGVPGLIHAYKTAAAMVLELTPAIYMPVMIQYQLQFDYTRMNDVMKIIKHYDCKFLKQDSGCIQNLLFCIMEIAVPKNSDEEMISELMKIHELEIKAI